MENKEENHPTPIKDFLFEKIIIPLTGLGIWILITGVMYGLVAFMCWDPFWVKYCETNAGFTILGNDVRSVRHHTKTLSGAFHIETMYRFLLYFKVPSCF